MMSTGIFWTTQSSISRNLVSQKFEQVYFPLISYDNRSHFGLQIKVSGRFNKKNKQKRCCT
jgi:hypothetical protein